VARRLLTVLFALVVASAAFSPSAFADADPASDVLFTNDAFVPYSPPPSKDATSKLSAAIKSVQQGGHAVKVAVIATDTDLGGVPQLYGKPQQYATFLDQEIKLTLVYKDTILIVMPQGYGVAGSGGGKARSTLASLKSPGTRNSSTLTDDAAAAVASLDQAGALPKTSSGAKRVATSHPGQGAGIKASNGSGSGGGGVPRLLLAAIAVVAFGAAGVIVWRVRRKAAA
jgi:hypothetical protein